MKKMITAILVFDLIAGLLFLGICESRGQVLPTGAADGWMAGAGEAASWVAEERAWAEDGVGAENCDPGELRKIALTFDDGPHPSYTEQLLDGLKKRGVRVTFFVTGEHAALHPDIIKRMQEDA